ncbi:LysR family transcriptional regulator [Pseudorhodoferax soli]|uniref:DNA-binding transcriptional LysR family regulator n=1 Tax=Pseudorhodoferax soli TaxID=545864 RepID=A0A368XN15_9BURK|nr:LysR family transcriptional regulator [Pseudorhodoferax soli]RCW68566.1 DNA-binding transcriptional LysR family regulator [Pseudorhodoferax soli]
MSYSPQDVSYYLAVAKEGHLGRAATACGISQPALSKALKRIESTAGVRLIERGSHGAKLTPAGETFLDYARAFDSHHEAMLRASRIMRAEAAGRLRIGMTNPGSESVAVRALTNLLKARPALRVTLDVGKSDALNAAVLDGQLDLAVVPSYPDHPFTSAQESFGSDTIRIAGRFDHPLAHGRHVEPTELAPFGWVVGDRASVSRDLLDEIFRKWSVPPPDAVMQIQFMSDTAMSVVASTDLLCLAPTWLIEEWGGRVRTIDVRDFALQRTLMLLSRPGSHWTPLMHAYREEVRRLSASSAAARGVG